MLFMAPEMFLKTGGQFTDKSDMWSMGIILAWVASALQLGTLQHPMLPAEDGEGFNVQQYELLCAYRSKEEPEEAFFDDMPDEFKELMLPLLVYEPSERASAADCLSNEWVAEGGYAPEDIDIPTSSVSLQNLSGIRNLTEGDKSMLSLVASNLHDDEASDLVRAFQSLDADKSGLLRKEEMVEGFMRCQLPFSKQDVEELFDTIDTNRSGTIDYHEWLSATIGHAELSSSVATIKAFDALDANCSGKIRTAQLVQLLGEQGAKELCQKFSRRNSLSLEVSDFSEAMQSILAKRQSAQD